MKISVKELGSLFMLLSLASANAALTLQLDENSLINPQIPHGNTRSAVGVMADPDNASNNVNVTFTITCPDPLLTQVSMQFDAVTVINNTSNLYNNSNFQRVDGSGVGTNLDCLGMRVKNPSSPATMEFTFDSPLEQLAIHFSQIDTSSARVVSVNGETSGFGLINLSGNLSGSLTSPDYVISPSLNASQPYQYGSIAFTGSGGSAVSSIVLELDSVNTSTDGYSLQITAVPEPTTSCLLAVCFGFYLLRRKVH